MRPFLRNISVIVILVLVLSLLLSVGSLWSLRRSSFYKPSFLVNAVKQDAFDYIVLGASTGLTTLNTHIIDSVNHTKGLNLSMDDTSLPSHYLMLQHFLAQGKRTKFCILAPNNASFDLKQGHLSNNDYRFLPYVSSTYVHDYYGDFSGAQARILSLSNWMPSAAVSYYNAEIFYPSLLVLLDPKRRNRFDASGNYTYPFIKYKDSALVDFVPRPLHFENAYLKKIKTLCDAHDIRLICYLSPMMDARVILENGRYEVINHSDFLKNARYFNDAIHVNSLGNRLTSLEFAEALKTYQTID